MAYLPGGTGHAAANPRLIVNESYGFVGEPRIKVKARNRDAVSGLRYGCQARRGGRVGVIRSVLFGFAVGTEHVDDFVLVKLLHLVAGRAEVFAGVELTGLVVEDLADSGGHGQTGVGVDVDFANGALGSLAELLFGDTDGIGELAAVGVDDVDIFLGNRA